MSTALSSLAGSLRVAPGASLPLALQSSRQDWAPRLARGQAVSALPGLMASLFNLCSHAHRLCSQLAIEAAAPGLLPAPSQVAQRLRTETAQEHIRRIGLDWPRLLATDAQGSWATLAQAALQACPLLAPTAFFLLIINMTYALFDTFGVIDVKVKDKAANNPITLVYKVYMDGFRGNDLGGSSAQSVILMIIVFVLTIFQFRFIERRVHYN